MSTGSRRAGSFELTYPVAGLLAEPPGSSRDFSVPGVAVEPGEGLVMASPVEGTVHLSRTNRGLLVRASLRTGLRDVCSRCLHEITVPLALTIDEEALPSIDLVSGLPLDTSGEPDAVRLTDHHELELEPLVRDAIVLAEPIAPLCRPDCPGLCLVCGEELATGKHDHPEAEIDPRLAALRDLQVDGERESD